MKPGGGLLVLVSVVALLAVPLAVEAQQAQRIYRIGLFHVGLDHVPPSLENLKKTLLTLGYEEARNLRLDWRNLPDEPAAHKTAGEFVRDGVDLIVAFENHTVRAAKAATSSIPIVMVHVTDPVKDGFVRSLAHPGGNVTGFAGLPDYPAKQLQIFTEILPGLRRVLLLIDPSDPVTPRQLAEVREAAATLRLERVERQATDEADVRHVFSSLQPREVDGVFVVSPNLYLRFTSLIMKSALTKRLPVAWHQRHGAEEGALFSYDSDLAAVGVEAARYIDKILKGTPPGQLPVQQFTRFELVINRKTAKALGLTIPPSLLLQADQVIE
jgi:putative ABC transport system substrate-binding protein